MSTTPRPVAARCPPRHLFAVSWGKEPAGTTSTAPAVTRAQRLKLSARRHRAHRPTTRRWLAGGDRQASPPASPFPSIPRRLSRRRRAGAVRREPRSTAPCAAWGAAMCRCRLARQDAHRGAASPGAAPACARVAPTPSRRESTFNAQARTGRGGSRASGNLRFRRATVHPPPRRPPAHGPVWRTAPTSSGGPAQFTSASPCASVFTVRGAGHPASTRNGATDGAPFFPSRIVRSKRAARSPGNPRDPPSVRERRLGRRRSGRRSVACPGELAPRRTSVRGDHAELRPPRPVTTRPTAARRFRPSPLARPGARHPARRRQPSSHWAGFLRRLGGRAAPPHQRIGWAGDPADRLRVAPHAQREMVRRRPASTLSSFHDTRSCGFFPASPRAGGQIHAPPFLRRRTRRGRRPPPRGGHVHVGSSLMGMGNARHPRCPIRRSPRRRGSEGTPPLGRASNVSGASGTGLPAERARHEHPTR